MTTTIIYRINTNNTPEKLFHFYSYAMLDYPIVRVRENTALKLNYFILASACSLSIFGENNDLDSAILVFRNMFFSIRLGRRLNILNDNEMMMFVASCRLYSFLSQ